MVPKGSCPGVKTEESSLLMLSFPLSEDALLIGLASSEQMVENACQLMRCGGNGFWSTEFSPHTAVVIAKNRLVVMQCVGDDAQRQCGAVLHVAGAHGQYLAAADAVVGTQAQPGSKRAALRNLDKSGPTSASKV